MRTHVRSSMKFNFGEIIADRIILDKHYFRY